MIPDEGSGIVDDIDKLLDLAMMMITEVSPDIPDDRFEALRMGLRDEIVECIAANTQLNVVIGKRTLTIQLSNDVNGTPLELPSPSIAKR